MQLPIVSGRTGLGCVIRFPRAVSSPSLKARGLSERRAGDRDSCQVAVFFFGGGVGLKGHRHKHVTFLGGRLFSTPKEALWRLGPWFPKRKPMRLEEISHQPEADASGIAAGRKAEGPVIQWPSTSTGKWPESRFLDANGHR